MLNLFYKILVLLGEALIVLAFFLFRGAMPTNIFVLYLIVTSVAYMSFFLDVFIPWNILKDKSHRVFGGLGVRWYCVILYAALAVAAMVVATFEYPLSFKAQLLLHGALMLVFLFGLLSAWAASEKVAQVHMEQQREAETAEDIKAMAAKLLLKAQTVDASEDATSRIEAFKQETRFLSPTNNPEVRSIDETIMKYLQALYVQIDDEELNGKSIGKGLSAIERLLEIRKSTYSV